MSADYQSTKYLANKLELIPQKTNIHDDNEHNSGAIDQIISHSLWTSTLTKLVSPGAMSPLVE